MPKLRAIFFWTPGLSATILQHLISQNEDIEIIWIVTNPDTVGGRGHEVMASPVAQFARKNNLTLLQPEKVRKNDDFLESIRSLNPDICLVVAYGKILPQELLDIPPMGFLNVHTSLLPKYRGAAPIQYALLSGEKVTGLTIQQMSLGMDEGDILVQEKWDVSPTDTTGSLFAKTGERWGNLLIQAVIGLRDKTITPIPQDHTQATYSKMIEKSDGQINPAWTLDQAYHAWQAFTPWPGLYSDFKGTKVTLLEVERNSDSAPLSKGEEKWANLTSSKGDWIETDTNSVGGIPPTPLYQGGKEFIIFNNLPAIQFSDWLLVIKKIHPAGKKPMSGEDFVRGYMGKS